LLPLVEFVAKADADRMFFAGDRERYEVPHVFRNAVNRQIVEVGRLVESAGSTCVQQAGLVCSGRCRAIPMVSGGWPSRPRSSCSRGLPVQAPLGRGFSSAGCIRTEGNAPACSRLRGVRCDSISGVLVFFVAWAGPSGAEARGSWGS
jgi:hypothetical protein